MLTAVDRSKNRFSKALALILTPIQIQHKYLCNKSKIIHYLEDLRLNPDGDAASAMASLFGKII